MYVRFAAELASATEIDIMPEFSICKCEQPDWKYVSFQLFGDGEMITMILHQSAPEFGFTVNSDGALCDSCDNHWDSAEQCEEWMRKAAEYIKGKKPIIE